MKPTPDTTSLKSQPASTAHADAAESAFPAIDRNVEFTAVIQGKVLPLLLSDHPLIRSAVANFILKSEIRGVEVSLQPGSVKKLLEKIQQENLGENGYQIYDANMETLQALNKAGKLSQEVINQVFGDPLTAVADLGKPGTISSYSPNRNITFFQDLDQLKALPPESVKTIVGNILTNFDQAIEACRTTLHAAEHRTLEWQVHLSRPNPKFEAGYDRLTRFVRALDYLEENGMLSACDDVSKDAIKSISSLLKKAIGKEFGDTRQLIFRAVDALPKALKKLADAPFIRATDTEAARISDTALESAQGHQTIAEKLSGVGLSLSADSDRVRATLVNVLTPRPWTDFDDRSNEKFEASLRAIVEAKLVDNSAAGKISTRIGNLTDEFGGTYHQADGAYKTLIAAVRSGIFNYASERSH